MHFAKLLAEGWNINMWRLWPLLLVLVLGVVACGESDELSSLEMVERNRKAVEEYRRDHPEISGPCYRAGRGRNKSLFQEHFLLWAPDGRYLLFDGELTTVWMANEEGSSVRMLIDANPGTVPVYGTYADVSPDGFQIVYATCDYLTWRVNPDYEIAKLDLRNGSLKRLTYKSYLDHYPVWSPDGSRIAFVGVPANDFNDLGARLYAMAADGSDLRDLVAVVPPYVLSQIEAMEKEAAVLDLKGIALFPPVWSPDGEKLAFLVYEGGFFPFRKILFTVRIDGSELTRIAEDVVSVASWSPDGQRLAVAKYSGDSVGLFTLAADGSDLRQVAAIIDSTPFKSRNSRYQSKVHTVAWSPDGSQLLYSCDSGACVVNLADGQITSLANSLDSRDRPNIAAWSPDGTRIAVYIPGLSQLYTVSREGTDVRGLVLEDGASGELVPWNAPQTGTNVDVAVCAAGSVVPGPVANPGLVQDCKVLLGLRDRLARHATLNWNSKTPISEWEGVTLGGAPLRVHELRLTRFGLMGTLPPELGQLVELRKISLWDNRLTGPIPTELGQLTRLVALELPGNYLSGGIPAALGNLTSLKVLELHGNFLDGSIPPELGKLRELRILGLAGNLLSGSIPPELGAIAQLKYLYLEQNNLSGCVLAELPDIWVEASGLERCA